jgi:glycerophosphoryl diester phosphodiesterase
MAIPPLLLGHRGARASASVAENTVASFDLAIQHGCDGFEFDVRLTGCGCAVVCHEPKVRGITVSEAVARELSDLPTVQDVLARFAKRAFLDIELKVPGLASQVLLALGEHPPQRGYVVSSFLPDVLFELSIRSGSIPLGMICENRKQLQRWGDLPLVYVIPEYSLITAELVQQVHQAGRMILAWTVNDKAAMLRLAEWGVDGIISDKTELLVRTLRPSRSK